MCVDSVLPHEQGIRRDSFINARPGIKSIIGYKVVRFNKYEQLFRGMYTDFIYKAGVNIALPHPYNDFYKHGNTIGATDMYSPDLPHGIHVYFKKSTGKYAADDFEWDRNQRVVYKSIEVSCDLEDLIIHDGWEAAFTKVFISEDQLKFPW